MRRLTEAAFLRKGVVLQPRQQTVGRRADDIDLRVMKVHVDKARRDDAAGQVFGDDIGISRRKALVMADRLNPLAALLVGAHHQKAILFEHSLLADKIQNRSTVSFHAARVTQQHTRRIQSGE